jgi:hypothetical protein
MRGFAAELSGARLWMKVATAIFVCVLEKYSKTCSKSNTMYGLQHKMKTVGNSISEYLVYSDVQSESPGISNIYTYLK